MMIELTEAKQFSRVLYTNPVCFLSTLNPSEDQPQLNVMVLSWITPVDNDGRFIFSLNTRRHTAACFRDDVNSPVEFCLSVPIKDMEDLVRNVGACSGQYGSKFPIDYSYDGTMLESDAQASPSSQKKKKRKEQPTRFPKGIPGLTTIPIGRRLKSDKLMAIDKTVAHLRCTSLSVQQAPEHNGSQQHHLIIMAQVTEGYVEESYWDTRKNIFRPVSPNVSPYLTFFGSQTFGYVVPECELSG